MKKALGIVIRYTDTLGDERVNTIDEHNRIFRAQGTVYVGKYGQPAGTPYLNLCCQEGSEVMLIMVKKSVGKTYEAHQARIKSGSTIKPPTILVPSYVNARKDIRCWFELGSEFKLMSKKDLRSWFVKSSGFPLLESLVKSMSGLFYVTQDKEMAKKALDASSQKTSILKRGRKKSSPGPVDLFKENFGNDSFPERGEEFMDITNFPFEEDDFLNEDNY